MNFLAPLFLLGALAVALPVIFHLIRRSVKERTLFSSLMFLLPSPPRLTRRSRLEQLLLLALRCAALCLLAFGFARPFLKQAGPQSPPSETAKRVLVLVDTSASMLREGVWGAAQSRTEEVIQKAGSGDEVAVFAFDRQLKSLVSFDQWNETAAGDRRALVRNQLASTKPTWNGTLLDGALTEASELFGDRGKDEFPGPKQIVVISDFQEGSRLTALQGYQWPKGVQIIQERVGPRAANNASLHVLADPMATPVTSESAVRVRISNSADSKSDQFRVGWADSKNEYVGKPVQVYVPAGQSRVVSVLASVENTSAERIVLAGDAEPFDNVAWVNPPPRSLATVTYIGADSAGDARQPLFFLQRALQDTPRQTFRIVSAGTVSSAREPQGNGEPLFVVTGAVTDQQAAGLKAALARGGTVLAAPTTVEAANSLGKVIGITLPAAAERKSDSYAMLAEIDFGHPLFSPFADSRFSDFTKIHFWRYRKMDFSPLTNVQTVARFDSGDPAIVSFAVGKGRVVVFTSGWHPADSQLALSSKFVPLLYSVVETSGTAPATADQYLVGAALPVAAAAPGSQGPVKIQMPNGVERELQPGETNLVATEPGIYSATSAGGTARFAVNLEPSESRTAPMAGDELDRLGVPSAAPEVSAHNAGEKQVRLQNAELESRQKLWRWLVVAALVVLLIETWLAGWTARRAVVTEEAA